MKFSGLFYLIAFLVALFVIGFGWFTTGDYISPYLVVPAAIAMIGYFMAPQLDWWWYKRFPLQLDSKVIRIYENNSPYYNAMDVEHRKLFNTRVAMYIEAKQWLYMGMEESMPYDLRAIIAFEPVRLTLHMKDYLLEPFDRIALYPNPFLSPNHPDRYHGSELFEGDGIVLFSLKHVLPAFQESQKYFNVVLYEFARILKLVNKTIQFPIVEEEEFWRYLPEVAHYGKREVMGAIGLPDVDAFAVAVHHYFVYDQYFRAVYPDLYDALDNIFTKFPIRSEQIDPNKTVTDYYE